MKLSHISNLLARSFLVFIIAWLWTSFYVRGFFLILLISVTITLVFNYVISLIYRKRGRAKFATKQTQEHLHLVTLQLKFMTKTQVQALFKKAVPSAKIHSLFHTTPTEQDIIKCIKSSKSLRGAAGDEAKRHRRQDTQWLIQKIILAAESFSPQVSAFARSLETNIIILDAEAVYTQVLAPTKAFPEITVQPKKKTPRKTIAEIKSMVLGRHRTKSYVITGIIILFSSLIVRLHIYYIIIATIVFALALSSYFAPKSPKNLFD